MNEYEDVHEVGARQERPFTSEHGQNDNHENLDVPRASEEYVDDEAERARLYILREWTKLPLLKRVELTISVLTVLVLIIYTTYTAAMYRANRDAAEAAKSAADTANKTLWEIQHGSGSIDTHTLADQAKTQSEQTSKLAKAAEDQAMANQQTASAAKRAADIADQTLHISQRALITLGIPMHDFQRKRVNIPIINSGHISSGLAKFTVHEFTVDYPSADHISPQIPISAITERHWGMGSYPTVASGSQYSIEIRYPNLDVERIKNGTQGVFVVVIFTYNDGFPDTPEQRFLFCDRSDCDLETRTASMKPCAEQTDLVLAQAIQLDEYPSKKYQDR